MFVWNIMTAPVISVEPTATIAEVAKLMLAQRISGLPVVNRDGSLAGIISESDLLRRSELGTEYQRSRWLEFFVSPGKAAEEYVHAHGRKVEEVMTAEVLTIRPSAPLNKAVEMMGRHHIKRLPVVEDGKLVGIVARSDILRALAQALPPAGSTGISDRQIRLDVMAELAKQAWGGANLVRVDVKEGHVELSGTIFDERERFAARVAAENIPGVNSVKDRLVWIEPMSGMVVLPLEDETTRGTMAGGTA